MKVRRSAGVLLAACASALLGWGAWQLVMGGFRLSGTVTSTPRLQARIETPNMVLFVSALNSGGVPVAVKRFVNPRLPLRWSMDASDMILPGRDWPGTLSVRVSVNSHGKVGETVRGDLLGEHRHPVHSGDSSVDVVVDSEAP